MEKAEVVFKGIYHSSVPQVTQEMTVPGQIKNYSTWMHCLLQEPKGTVQKVGKCQWYLPECQLIQPPVWSRDYYSAMDFSLNYLPLYYKLRKNSQYFGCLIPVYKSGSWFQQLLQWCNWYKDISD